MKLDAAGERRRNINIIWDLLPDFVLKKAWRIVAATLFLTAGIAAYSVLHFRIDTDFDALVSNSLHSQRSLVDFEKLFPQLNETLIIVVEGKTAEETRYARDLLSDRLRRHRGVFRSIFAPGGGPFYRQNGLLYLNQKQLDDLGNRLAEVQPFLGMLSREFSLKNFFETMAEITTKSGNTHDAERLDILLGQIANTMEKADAGETSWLSWQALMSGNPNPGPQTELLLVRPYLDASALNPVQAAIEAIKQAKSSLRADGVNDVSVGTTGNLALKAANLNSVKNSIGIAAAASFVLVTLLLVAALQSLWLIGACLTVLVIGLIWTLGFAMLAIGRLNIMSAAFLVLFIGLGIDYGIQYCLRYKELVRQGVRHDQAIRATTREVGKALFMCTMATAIGFYAFVPTAYAGASELGLISGTSMFILFAANLIVLPALLHIKPPSFKVDVRRKSLPLERLTILPQRFPRAIAAAGLLACLGGAASIPGVYFDFNPLNLNDTGSDAVRTAKKLLKTPDTSFWTMSVMTGSAEEADGMARRLEKLPTVKKAVSIFNFVPARQDEKIDAIREMAFFLPQIPRGPLVAPKPPGQTMAAIRSFRKALSEPSVAARFPSASHLVRILDRLLNQAENGQAIEPVLERMTTSMLLPLKMLLDRLNRLMDPRPFAAKDLPPQLVDNYVAGGRYRVQVFPSQNLDHLSSMQRFVDDVRRIAPDATGTPLGIVGAGKAISQAFVQAFATALVAIVVFLAIMTRSAKKVSLIVFPLAVGLGMTVATTDLLGIPFNFANIIVLPLMLGIGVDYPVHLVHRYVSDPSARNDILRTSTARGLLFSALTTIASFSSLSFSAHHGMAELGIMLTICITFMTAATLVLLPAVLYLFWNR